jgi:hypothetical protein
LSDRVVARPRSGLPDGIQDREVDGIDSHQPQELRRGGVWVDVRSGPNAMVSDEVAVQVAGPVAQVEDDLALLEDAECVHLLLDPSVVVVREDAVIALVARAFCTPLTEESMGDEDTVGRHDVSCS